MNVSSAKFCLIVWLAAALAQGQPPARMAGPRTNDVVKSALNRMYNVDFTGANRVLDDYIQQQPADPLGHTFRAASDLFFELDRLKELRTALISAAVTGKIDVREEVA